MPLIGIRELRQETAQILRRIREDGARYIVTDRGQPVALLLPLNSECLEDAIAQAATRSIRESAPTYQLLAEEIRARWPASQDTQQLLDSVRER